MKSILPTFLLLCLATAATSQAPNNTLHGKVFYQSSGNKPAVGVRIVEPDANPTFSVDNGDYVLKFQNKRNGAALALEVGKDDGKSQKLELVNEKEVKGAKLPADANQILEIIVCPFGQRDIAAQKYYRILRTTADRELEKKKKEVEDLQAQKEKDYKKISDLFAQLDGMQAALDSAKIREQAFNIASINLDRASQMVRDAVKMIAEENDVEGALRILSVEALDTAYLQAVSIKKQGQIMVNKADFEIKQVIQGYEFKIGLLEPQFKYREIAECYEKIVDIYEKEGYDKIQLAEYLSNAATYWGKNGNYDRQLDLNQKSLTILKNTLPADHPTLASSYSNLASANSNLGDFQKALELNRQALAIREKAIPINYSDLALSYNELATNFYSLGENQKSLDFNLKAIDIWEKATPADHSVLATSYSNLATTYGHLGEYQKQLDFNKKALAILDTILPLNHPDLAWLYNNLAGAYSDLGMYSEALKSSQQATVILEKILPANHPDLAWSYNLIALIYRDSGEYQKALDFDLKAVAIRVNVLDKANPDLASSYNSLALTYDKLDDENKSLEFNRKSLDIEKNAQPVNLPHLAIAYNNLADTYRKLGMYQKALEFNLEALTIREKILSPDHPDLAITYSNISCSYRDVHDYKNGILYGLKAIKIGESSTPKHLNLDLFYANLGITYAKAHQFPEAKAFLEKSQALLEDAGIFKCWAIYYGIQNDRIKSFENLKKSVDFGFKDLKWITTEESLECIRDWAAYKNLVEQLKK